MTEQVERAVRRIAEQVTANAPDGWVEAVLVGAQERYDSLSLAGWHSVPGMDQQPIHPLETLQPLREAIASVSEARGWDRTRLEMRCRPSGEFALTASRETVSRLLGSRPGFHAVLDRSYRLPQPGFAQEEGTACEAGGPDLAVARLRTYLRRRAEILGRSETLPPPVTTAALDDAELRLGRPLPADLRALYLVADGSGDDAVGLFGNLAWMSLDRLLADHADLREPVWAGWEASWNEIVLDADPPGTVRRCHRHPGWFPFATAGDGNYLAVDMSPAPVGRLGQVIQIGRDFHDGPLLVADSVTSLLDRYLHLLEQGAYEVEEDEQDFIDFTEGPRRPGPTTGGSDALPPALRAGLGPTTDLVHLQTRPVEALVGTLHSGDLQPLENHQHLTVLDLSTVTPVDIAPLRTIPNLRCLDLSGAEVIDLAVLADLPDLRYLALTGRQWAALLDHGELPATLAAARLADKDASLDEARNWAQRLGLDGGEPFHVAGTLTPGHTA